MAKENQSLVLKANEELQSQIGDESSMRALMATTFSSFKDVKLVKQACLEAMIRGYSFKDIIAKKIYAIPYSSGYSLVQSIGDVRSIAMRSGQIGKGAPEFTYRDDNGVEKVDSCTITVRRLLNGTIGDYSATVYFDEYYKKGSTFNGNYKPSQWDIRPRTMIAKVAEMHALRMAFPDELDQAYVEEEFQKEVPVTTVITEDRFAEAKKSAESLKMKSHEVDTVIHDDVCAWNKGGICDCVPVIK